MDARTDDIDNYPNADVIAQLIDDGAPATPWTFCITSDFRALTDIRTINTIWATTTNTPCVPATDSITGGILKQIVDCGPKFIVANGDMVFSGRNDAGNEQWTYYTNVKCCLDVPYMIDVAGNHELVNASGPANFATYAGDYDNSFDYGGIRFIYMNNVGATGGGTNGNWATLTADQLTWLEGELEEEDSPSRVFIFMHIPPLKSSRWVDCSSGPSWNRPMERLATFLGHLADAEAAGKTITVVNGHWQYYERFNRGGIQFFTGALGGEILYDMELDDLGLYTEDPPFHFTGEYAFVRVTVGASSVLWEPIRAGDGTTPNSAYVVEL